MKNFKNLLLIIVFCFSLFSYFNPIEVNAQCGVLAPGSDEWWASGCNVNDPNLGTTTYTGNNSSASVATCKLPDSPKLQDLFTYVNCIINLSIIPLIFTFAMAFFIWGVVQYMLADADERKRETGKQYMVWGIIGLTVMVSMWGLVNILAGTFGLDSSFIPQVSP